MAIRARQQKGRPQGRSASFQRRLTWREIEIAFAHFLDVGWVDDEAQRWLVRFKRARSQLLPVFSWMVISPYERERTVAVALLERIGGAATLKMLDDILADDDVLDAYKLELGHLRDLLAPSELAEAGDDDEEDEDALEGVERERPADTEGEEVAEEPATAVAGGRRGSRRSGRGRRRRKPATEAAGAAYGEAEAEADREPVDAAVFDGPAEAFLALLEGPVEPVHAAFATLPLPKRLSFIDRSGRLDDARVLAFLLPLLDTAEWSLVQSALRAIGTLGRVEALPVVTALAEGAQRKRIQQRAERVRDALQAIAASQPQPEPVVEVPAEAEAPEQPAQPKPLRRGRQRGRQAAAEPAEGAPTAEPDITPEPPAAEPPRGRGSGRSRQRAPLAPADPGLAQVATPRSAVACGPAEAPAKLPKLVTCLAGGIESDGAQRLYIYRLGEGEGVDRLYVRVHDDAGWLDALLVTGLPADQPRLDAAVAAEAQRALVEVPVGYVRRRVVETAEQGKPAGAEATLAWIGGSRKVDVEAAAPDAPAESTQPQIEALLNHDFCRDWVLPLQPDGRAVAEWLSTGGKRSASRVRRRLIDEVAAAWVATGLVPRLATWLRLQSLLLERGDQRELATVAATVAAELVTGEATENFFLRELVYRGFQAALDHCRRGRALAEQHGLVCRGRRRLTGAGRPVRLRRRPS